jgi:hypothetical protein
MGERTFIDTLENVEDEVARWASNLINDTISALAPDGRGYQKEVLSDEEQLRVYAEEFRGNREAWAGWLQKAVDEVVNLLKEAGLSEADIAAVHPYSLAQGQAMRYSLRMERLLAKRGASSYAGTDQSLPPAEEQLIATETPEATVGEPVEVQ